jgi:DNA-binding IclR family transcriptional regulator
MSAPALEKGLDILELVVAVGESLTLTQIAVRCGRSVSEIQRMVQVLQKRGYLSRTDAGSYQPGLKLYQLGRFRHPFRQLQSVAEPIMAELAHQLGHSIHLSVEDKGEMLILSEVTGSGTAAVTLQVGSRHPLRETLSGRILLLNQQPQNACADARALAEYGYLEAFSGLFLGVLDLGTPIRPSPSAAIQAVLACSWLQPREKAAGSIKRESKRIANKLIKAAHAIAKQA